MTPFHSVFYIPTQPARLVPLYHSISKRPLLLQKPDTLTVILTCVKIIAIANLNNNEQYLYFVSYLYIF